METQTPKTGLVLLDYLRDKYTPHPFAENCHPSFQNLLWQLIINGVWKDKKPHCFVPVLSDIPDTIWEIGIAEQDERGYYPTRVLFKKGLTFDECSDIIDDINQEMFGYTPNEAFHIVATSMRQDGMGKRAEPDEDED